MDRQGFFLNGPEVVLPMTLHKLCTEAERDAAVGRLGLHYTSQHLIRAEYNSRVALAKVARLTEELDHLFADLPQDEPPAVKMRCTRADRDKIADVLSQHFAAGSLDGEEADARIDKAMHAVYLADLAGLCDIGLGSFEKKASMALLFADYLGSRPFVVEGGG
jgi:Domain of unknown function (DUF1707)